MKYILSLFLGLAFLPQVIFAESYTCPYHYDRAQTKLGDNDTLLNSGDVMNLQFFLMQYYHVESSAFKVGVYDTRMLGYVKKFQKQFGLPQTGVVGPMTKSIIEKICAGEQPVLSKSKEKPKLIGFRTPKAVYANISASWNPTYLETKASEHLTYFWSWGDGTGVSTKNSHTFKAPGKYTGRVYVVNGAGVASDTYLFPVTVEPAPLITITVGLTTTQRAFKVGDIVPAEWKISGPYKGQDIFTGMDIENVATKQRFFSTDAIIEAVGPSGVDIPFNNGDSENIVYVTPGEYRIRARLYTNDGELTASYSPIFTVTDSGEGRLIPQIEPMDMNKLPSCEITYSHIAHEKITFGDMVQTESACIEWCRQTKKIRDITDRALNCEYKNINGVSSKNGV